MVTQQLAASSSSDIAALKTEKTSAAEILQYFGEKQMKEIAFSEAKKSKALVEQLLLKVLPQDQTTPELTAAAEEYCRRAQQNQRENTNNQKLAQKRVIQKEARWCRQGTKRMFLIVHSTHVFVEVLSLSLHQAAWTEEALIYGPDRGVPMTAARIFVANDPNNCTSHMKFVGGLLGGIVATPQFVESKGKDGICVAYKAAIVTVRRVFVTPLFMGSHTAICRDLLEILKIAECKWQLMRQAELDQFVQKLTQAKARQVIIFHGPAEAALFPASTHRFSSVEEAVVDPVICSVDLSRSRTGICPAY